MAWTAEIGIHKGIPNADYHADTAAVSASPLVTLYRYSPAHMVAERDEDKEDSRALVVGSAMHALLSGDFEAECFEVLPPGKTGASKEAKAIAAAGKPWLSAKEYAQAEGCASAITRNPKVKALLQGADQEVSVVWQEEESGLLCKCRPDLWRPDLRLVADYKSIGRRATKKNCAASIAEFGYDIKAAHYLAGTSGITFLWIFVEKDPPHGVKLYTASGMMVPIAEAKRQEALALWAKCAATDTWPCYPPIIEDIELPGWAD